MKRFSHEGSRSWAGQLASVVLFLGIFCAFLSGLSGISKETSETMKTLLEAVVHDGTGKRAYLPGFRIGGKTATSEKLPRSSNQYISSFLGFAPAENPQVIALVLIDEPEGIYYGGTIAAPVMAELFEVVLPYLEIEQTTISEPDDK